jgi:hypothetical protein
MIRIKEEEAMLLSKKRHIFFPAAPFAGLN